MERPVHKIELLLNSTGFTGSDVEALLPDFVTEHETVVGLTWYPSAEGPERYYIAVSILAALSLVSKVFLEELFKDVYAWIKGRVLPVIKRKPRSMGSITIVFQDARVWCPIEGNDDLLACVESIPRLLLEVDAAKSSSWDIEISEGKVKIAPSANDRIT